MHASREMEPLHGSEFGHVMLLLEQADDAVKAVRGSAFGSGIAAVVSELPILVKELGAEFVVHAQTILRGGKAESGRSTLKGAERVTSVGGQPTALALLVRLVEVLDALVAAENEDDLSWSSPGRLSRRGGGEAGRFATYGDEAHLALKSGLANGGFFKACLACLRGGSVAINREWAHELALHSILAVRLTLAWMTPPNVQTPSDVLLSAGGHGILLDACQELMHFLKETPDVLGPDVTSIFGELALTLDTMRLSLRANSCVARLARSSPKSADRQAISSMVVLVMDTLSQVAAITAEAQSADPKAFQCIDDVFVASDAVVAVAVHLLAALTSLPGVVSSHQLEDIAASLNDVLKARPLTIGVAGALRSLVGLRPKGSWFGNSGSLDHKLRVVFSEARVPSECVRGAVRAIEETTFEQSHSGAPRSLREKAAREQDHAIIVATLYEHVEAIAIAVHGCHAVTNLMRDLKSLRDVEVNSTCDEDSSKHPVARKSFHEAFGRLRHNVKQKFGSGMVA